MSSDTRVTTLQDIDPVKVEFSVPEAYARELATGATIRFRVQGVDEPFGPGRKQQAPNHGHQRHWKHHRQEHRRAKERHAPQWTIEQQGKQQGQSGLQRHDQEGEKAIVSQRAPKLITIPIRRPIRQIRLAR